jgi:hypothetical protein
VPVAVGAAAAGAVIAALVISLSPHSGHGTATGNVRPTNSARPTPTPTVGNLHLSELQAGDCLTGSNMQLNKNSPWPRLTLGVPCSQPHTAEVFYANNSFWKNGPYPGDSTISKDGDAACNQAFAAYVGIAYSKSIYTTTNILPDSSTWSTGDRALHCVAYYPTQKQPAGATLRGSIKGTHK